MTNPRSIPLARIEVTGSRFRLSETPAAETADPALVASIGALGLLDPPLVVETVAGSWELFDGARRLAALAALGAAEVSCRVLPGDLAATELLRLLAVLRRDELRHRLSARARLLRLGAGLGLPRPALRDTVLPLCGVEPQDRLLALYEQLATLPAPVLAFCDEKGLSLRQCAHLADASPELLGWLLSLREAVQLTASSLLELAEVVADILRRDRITVAELATRPELQSVLAEPLDNRQRGQRLRTLIRGWRSPTLTAIHRRLAAAVDTMDLPATMTVSWDPSLERREVVLKLTLQRPQDLEAALAALAAAATARGIEILFEEL